jgi:chromosome segregation ATPase
MVSPASVTGTAGLGDDVERAALAGVLAGRDTDQLVEEVITAWDELKQARESLAHLNQRNRVLELDLAEREDLGAPERVRLQELEEELRDRDSRIIHLERMVDQSNREKEELASSHDVVRIDHLEGENITLQAETSEQSEVIAEMEAKLDQLVNALEKAAEAGLTSISADEVRQLNRALDDAHRRLETSDLEAAALEDERGKLRDMVEQVRGMVETRDLRIKEIESQLKRVMEGPRSISAEHDYLVEQVDELKRRLLERNREYEAIRRRERRLHREVFERDEQNQELKLTLGDIEGGLSDRTAELTALEKMHEQLTSEVESMRRSERTREVVSSAFQESLGVLKAHEQMKSRRKESGSEEEEESTGEPESPGGTAPPALRDIDELED